MPIGSHHCFGTRVTVSSPTKTSRPDQPSVAMSVEPYVVKRTGWFAAASKYVTEGSASFTRRMPPGDCIRATFQIVRAMQAEGGAETSTPHRGESGGLSS